MHSPVLEEDENVEYIIIDPLSLSDSELRIGRSRSWEPWETETLVEVMRDRSKVQNNGRDDFYLVQQEMRKRGVERWDSAQIQKKWRKLHKKSRAYRNGVAEATTKFKAEVEEVLMAPPSSYLEVDANSGDEIMEYEVETLEPADHVSVLIDNADKVSHGSYTYSALPGSDEKSSASEEGQDEDSAHQSISAMQNDDMQDTKDLWPHRGVLRLLKQYKKMEREFFLGTRRHHKIWADIANAINSISPDLNVTGSQCQQKISDLKRTYFSVKDNHNRASARNEKVSWPYYAAVDKVFGEEALLSSTVSKTQNKDSSNSSSSEDETYSSAQNAEFAQSTFSAHAQQQEMTRVSTSSGRQPMMDASTDRVAHLERDPTALNKWPHEAVLLFLGMYREKKTLFEKGQRSHKYCWEIISQELYNHGYSFTWQQCQTKFDSLKRRYKGVVDRINKSGSYSRKWPYYRVMMELCGSKPQLKPVSVALSSDPPQENTSTAPKSENLSALIMDPSPFSLSSRSRVETILEQYMEDVKKHRETLRSNKEKRAEEKERRRETVERQRMEQRRRMHEERMTMQRAALELLKQILAKNTK